MVRKMTKFYQQQGRSADVAMYSRVVLSRNFKDMPFMNRMDAQDAAQLFSRVEQALAAGGYSFVKYDFTVLPATARGALAEEGLAPQSLVSGNLPRGVFASEDESLAVIVGDEDHIKIQAQCAGADMGACLKAAQEIDALLDNAFGYAYNERYGYLTASPVNLGCALRAGITMHLPAIAGTSGIRALSAASARMGLELSGQYGDGSCVWQLSNAKSFAIAENELCARIESAAEKIMERERTLRRTLAQESREYLENRVYRALGILGNARVISAREAAALLSDARLGAGIVPDVQAEKLDEIFRFIGPCAVSQSDVGEEKVKTEVKRAAGIRRALCG